MKKSTFFDFLNRYAVDDFESFLAKSEVDIDYIDWNGYCLISAYTDAETEYNAVRNGCALFDASPVKKYRFSGTDAGAFLDTVLTRRVSGNKSMRVSYAILCNEDGMLRDDGLLYKFSDDDYLLMVSEIDHDEHFGVISHRFDDLRIDEITPSLSGLAFQGPKSCDVLKTMGLTSIETLRPFVIEKLPFGNGNVTVARVGFTADLGYELWFGPELVKEVGQAVRRAENALGLQIDGYGLDTLNILRVEGGFVVPGWDTAQTFEDDDFERTPAELGIAWTVDLDRAEDFIGKAALLEERATGPRFKTTGVAIDQECDAAEGMKLYTIIDGKVQQAGTIPSVVWSFGLKRWLGIASIQSVHYSSDLSYHVQSGGEHIACHVVKLPFVKYDRYRQVPAPC